MSFINFCGRFSRAFCTFFIVLLFGALFAFITAGSSAQALYVTKESRDETGRFSILAEDSTTYFDAENNVRADKIPLAAALSDSIRLEKSNPPEKKIRGIKDSTVFAEFENWIEQNRNRNFSDAGQHTESGIELAIRRRALLKELIQQDPQMALGKAISSETYDALPTFITEHLEKRISANGDFLIYTLDGSARANEQATESRTERRVIIGEFGYKAFVYGRRETMTTKLDIPLQGFVIDDLMVVDESPVRRVNATGNASRAVDETASDATAEVGGKIVYFSNQSELDHFVDEQIEWESTIGPERLKEGSAQSNSAPEQTASPWTVGAKTVLFIRADFSDKVGVPVDRQGQPLTIARAQNLLNSQVNSFYTENSYNNTSIQATVTELVRMPRPLSFYVQSNDTYNTLMDDARAVARAAGYNTENYNLDMMGFSFTPVIAWDGIGLIGGKGSLLNGAFYLPETAHELGHNYGLEHANLWRTTDGTSTGQGYHIDTGDCYDMMGSWACNAQEASSHFNAHYKNNLGWLTNVKTVTTTGRHTLYAQDSNSQGGTRALKIKRNEKNNAKNYWVEFRQLASGNAMNGALIRWDYESRNFRETELLDMTPTTSARGDEPLMVGQTFTDVESGIKIKVISRNDTTPKSIEVEVEIDKIVNCAYSIESSSINLSHVAETKNLNVVANSDCDWTATSNAFWITVTSNISGRGDNTISYTVDNNINGGPRTGTITVAGKTFTVNQAAGSCSYSISPSPVNISASGGPVSFTHGCNSLTLVSADVPWITVSASSATVSANSGAARSGKLRLSVVDISGATIPIFVTVNQSAGQTTACTYSLSSGSADIPLGGGTGSFSINTGSGCTWTAVSNVDWISVASGANGNGSGTVTFSVAAHSGVARTQSITVAGQAFTINQAGGKSRKRVRIF